MKTLKQPGFATVDAESAKRICCLFSACMAVLMTGCKVELPEAPNTSPFTYWSETRGRVEFRELKKWAEEGSRTMNDLREKLGSPQGGVTNAAGRAEKWIYKNKFYDKEPRLLISVVEIPIGTNGIVERPLPAYKP